MRQGGGDRRARGAAVRIGLEQRPREVREVGRRVGAELAHLRELALPLADQDLGDRAATRRDAAGQELVDHGAQAVPVRGGARRVALEQLGRHVHQRPRHRPGDAGEAEVEHADLAGRGDQDVRRLQIAVEVAERVELADRVRDAAERAAQRAGTGGARVLGQHHAVDQLHREERRVVADHEIEEPDQPRDVDVGQRAELGLDPDQRVERHLAEPLERDGRAVFEVHRLVDVAARPAADQVHEPVAAGEDLRFPRHGTSGPQYGQPAWPPPG